MAPLLVTFTSGNIACIIYDMFTNESKSTHGLQKWTSQGHSQSCTVNVVLSWKRCQTRVVVTTKHRSLTVSDIWINGLLYRDNSDNLE